MRNRIISGLSDGVLVVEAKKKSGSLITADLALEQGRNVYAIPGRIGDRKSAGTNNLIKQGAMCVTSSQDIIDDLNIYSDNSLNDVNKEDIGDAGDENKDSLSEYESTILDMLSLEPVYIDNIIEVLRLNVSDCLSLLYSMEERGYIRQVIKGYYIVNLSKN